MAAVVPKAWPVAAALENAREFVDFVNRAVTPFHAVSVISEMLSANGYVGVSESAPWPELQRGSKYFVTRNGSSIVAFAIGGKYEPGKGFKIVGGHTDSPNFALKPKTHVKKGGMHGIGVQCYGGGLWHTWFDRELTVAGRVTLQKDAGGPLSTALVNLAKPLLRIPSLAIHLRSQAERDAFSPNKESHLVPLMATELAIAETLQAAAVGSAPPAAGSPSSAGSEQSPLLMQMIAQQLGCAPSAILDFDLSVVDTQPAAVGGALDEFVFAPRIDNLASCFCGVKALIGSSVSLAEDDMVRMVALFDHEEVGSESSQGAAGSLITDLVERFAAVNTPSRCTSIANSFLLSVDCAHAAHPNYMDKHEEAHRPTIHGGTVIKYNANTRYATNGFTGGVVRALAAKANVPVQAFCVKNDSPCGSTIGPILSTLSGIQAADIGAPMLSMHSVRETCGTLDLLFLTKLLEAFFAQYQSVRSQVAE